MLRSGRQREREEEVVKFEKLWSQENNYNFERGERRDTNIKSPLARTMVEIRTATRWVLSFT